MAEAAVVYRPREFTTTTLASPEEDGPEDSSTVAEALAEYKE